ncbi:MAG: biopolymer transporter ExbD [Paucibacter sp.]|nr:biopolymer transporter ExbD [Roseateles sp.]
MKIRLEDEEPVEIGLIALIDCIFFLLMFFMVATSFKQQDAQKRAKELHVTLPTAAVSFDAAQAGTVPLVITIDARGSFAVDGQGVSIQALRERLHREAQTQPGRTVRIDGDRSTPYQYIVHVIDLCEFEGLRQVSLRARP